MSNINRMVLHLQTFRAVAQSGSVPPIAGLGTWGMKMIKDNKKYFAYILQSVIKNKYYAGQTYNVEKRLQEHNEGLSGSTKFGKPWKLV